MNQNHLQARRAIEALRAGVPNGDVVRMLPLMQQELSEKYVTLLKQLEDSELQPKGFIISGDFGSGKSHCLEHFQREAVEHGYVCSRVVISKETPLFDLAKLYRQCLETATVRGITGSALFEIALRYKTNTDDHLKLVAWLETQQQMDPRFAATLRVFENFNETDSEVMEAVLREWVGYPMKIPYLKAQLKKLGLSKQYSVGKPKKGQFLERFVFIAALFKAAGYKGWVILLDEVELISRYGLRQRARSYANLAHILGLTEEAHSSHLGTIATIIGNFDGLVLREGKRDYEKIPLKLEGTRDQNLIMPSVVGMNAILRGSAALNPVNKDGLLKTYAQVREIYSTAYEWVAPDLPELGEVLSFQSMRQFLRAWISQWDLLRLYGYEADIEAEELEIDTSESEELSNEKNDEEGDGV